MSSRPREGSRPFPNVELLPDRVRKRRPAAMIAVEAEKTARAAAIASETKLFRVPEVLAADAELGVLDTERIPDLIPVREFLLRERDADALMRTIGLALAAIHERLVLPEAMRVPLPQPFAAPELGPEDVVVHGDFNTLNLFVRRSTGELVITDWEVSFRTHRLANPALHEVATMGPRYYDVGWFVVSLFLRTWFGLGRIFDAPGRAEQFLGSYFSAAGPDVRPQRFPAYLDTLAAARREIERKLDPPAPRLRQPRTPAPWYRSVHALAASLAARYGSRSP